MRGELLEEESSGANAQVLLDVALRDIAEPGERELDRVSKAVKNKSHRSRT